MRQAAEVVRRALRVGAARAVSSAPGAVCCGARRAFTLIELLVVIVVIGLLIAALLGIANTVIYNQKVRNTRAIMKNVTLAIEQFAAEDPLRLIYNGKNPSFGPYPPYQLAGVNPFNPRSLAYALEPQRRGGAANRLAERLWRDVGGGQGSLGDWVWLSSDAGQGHQPAEKTNDDIRALYVYLKLYAPAALAQVPEPALRPLTGDQEWVDPSGQGGRSGAARTILGIHDAWGVPLDYLLYVKLDWRVGADGGAGLKVTDRIPVLRSRGISRELYETQRRDRSAPRDPSRWIFSVAFPTPRADPGNEGFWADGIFDGDQDDSGWARAVAQDEDYGYYPDPQRDGRPPGGR